MAQRVLIVDDQPNSVLSLEFLIRQAGYEVDSVRDGEQALVKFEQSAPDLLLLNLLLPAVNSFHLLRAVRRNAAWRSIAIILLVAKGRVVEVEKGLALGADAYLTKPFATHDLLSAIRRCLDDG